LAEGQQPERPLRIGIVAGESSGDLLGAGLIRAIQRLRPGTTFEGIAGPEMEKAGCRALYSAEALSVMGLSEVLDQLPRLLRVRRALKQRFYRDPPDVFVGIDAPDFNLGLERALKASGVPTAHVVSPSVWAWRRYRIRRIGRSTDLMLTLFPFEEEIYRQHNIAVACIGHPLADMIPGHVDRGAARRRLDLDQNRQVVAVLPGSRDREVQQMGRHFMETVTWCREKRPGLQFVFPFVNEDVRNTFLRVAGNVAPMQGLTFLEGNSHDAFAAADAVLLASGTAALESLLFKRPMVVAYRLSVFSWHVLSRLVKLPYYSLPNLLAGRQLVPEFIQGDINVHRMGQALLYALDTGLDNETSRAFEKIHQTLRRGADHAAAIRIIGLTSI